MNDYHRRELVVAVKRLSPSRYRRLLGAASEHGVGIARARRTPADSDTAELPALVADDWQGR